MRKATRASQVPTSSFPFLLSSSQAFGLLPSTVQGP